VISALIRSGRFRAILLLFLITSLPAAARATDSSTSPKDPPQKPSQTQSAASQQSPQHDLEKRLQAQHDAIQASDPAAIETTSRAVVAIALRSMAQTRSAEAAWIQALGLYRQSLVLEDDPGTRIELATTSISAGKYEEGLSEIDKVLATNPTSAEGWHIKGRLLMAKEDYSGAAEAVTRSLDLDRNVNAQLLLALAYLKLKQVPKAQSVFQQMLRDYGDRAIWHFVFGGAYRDTGYPDDAIREFKKALALDPNLPHVHYFLALAYLDQNTNYASPEIIKEYEEEIEQFPNDFFGNYGLGGLEFGRGQIEQSNKHLLTAAKAAPDNPAPWLYLGLNAYKQKDNRTAETYLRRAIRLTGDDVAQDNYQIRRGYIALGHILASEGKKNEAQVYFDKAKELSDKSLHSSEEALASDMTSNSVSAPAVVTADTAPRELLPSTDAKPVDLAADIGAAQVGQTRLTHEQVELAEQRVKALRAILGSSYNDWGTSEARRGQYGMALSHFHDAEKWDDSAPGLMRNIGLAALKLGDNDEAARAFRVAVSKDPNDTQARAMLAISLYSSRKYADAAKAFGEVGDGVYRDPRMTYAWAYSLAQTNDPKKTIEVLSKLTAQPLPKEMWMTSGDLYTQVDDYEDALRCFRQAIKLDPNTERAHHLAGVALIRLGRPSEAIPELEAELKLAPNDPDTQYNLAYALLETSQKDQAMALLQKLINEHPDHAQAQYQFGKELLNSGDKNQAIVHLEAAARLEPNVDYIAYQLQAAYRKAGRTSDADKEMQVYRDIKDTQREKGVSQPKQ
jgi:tetratricopeptide (TPR) repeat protein